MFCSRMPVSVSLQVNTMCNFSRIYSFFFISVPVRDDGNMPDVPAHPSDPQGPNLDWLRNL